MSTTGKRIADSAKGIESWRLGSMTALGQLPSLTNVSYLDVLISSVKLLETRLQPATQTCRVEMWRGSSRFGLSVGRPFRLAVPK